MFDSLKNKLKKSVKSLADKVSHGAEERKAQPEPAKSRKPVLKKPAKKPKPEKKKAEKTLKPQIPEEKIPEKKPLEKETKEPEISGEKRQEKEKKGILGRIKSGIIQRELSEEDIDRFFADNQTDFLQANIALGVIDAMKSDLKEKLANRPIKRTKAGEFIAGGFKESILSIVNQGSIDLEKAIKEAKGQGHAACIVFLGFNGSGKTTSIAKVARYLQERGYRPVLAAGDTFRAASIEQLEHHGEKLGIKVIKHQYGSDSAAVIFDARKYAEANNCDIVLADTAGRTHVDKNLMDELEKVIRVNRPDLKILVIDSLTGNDAVEQAEKFNDTVGVDAVMMTKIDVNKKGGSILSVCHTIKKPILFLGTGQGYKDLEKFMPEKFVKEIMG